MIYLVLHDIRSAYNVGSIFRTADAAGVSKVYLTGITPTPIDRFGRKRKDFQKTALGAEETVVWEYAPTASHFIQKLKDEKVYIVGVEQAPYAISYTKISPKKKGGTAFVFGNEVKGLFASILKQCDVVAEIPMRGEKESLNVAVSVGVVLFRILDI